MNEKTYTCGAIPSPADKRDYRLAVAAPTTLPAKYIRKMPPVINQGSIGNCVAQALCYCSAAVEGRQFDPNWIYGKREANQFQGMGWFISAGLKTLNNYGNVPLESGDPKPLEVKAVQEYVSKNIKPLTERAEPYKIEAYARLTTPEEVKRAIYEGLYVVACVNVTTYDTDEDFLWPCVEQNHGCHAISLWGWEDNRFRVLNSWGEDWGDHGCCWISGTDLFRLLDVWAITDEASDIIVPPDPDPEDEPETEDTMHDTRYTTGIGEGKSAVLRAEADSGSDMVGTIKDGQTVTVLAKDGDRALISTGTCGWIQSKFLTDTPPKPQDPDTPTDWPETVEGLQQALTDWGFGAIVGSIDGKSGPKTEEATKQFQAAMGLSVDGVAGKNTWAALRSGIIKPRISEADMACQCEKYCDGYPNVSTAGIRLLVERIWRKAEEKYPGLVLYITNRATPTPDKAIAGGQRCERWNVERGGASKSQHLYGKAADIYGKADGVEDSVVRKHLEGIALDMNTKGGVGYGAKYIVHVDIRGYKARWEY